MLAHEPAWTTRDFTPRPVTPAPIYDLVVIGAGYTGLATAYYAAVQGASVCVLDRGDLSDAASARNAGFCTISPPIGLDALRREGAEVARAWYGWFERATDHCEALTEALAGLAPEPIGFARVGNVRLAQTGAQLGALRRQFEGLRSLGIKRRLLGARDLDMPSGSAFTGGLFDARSASLNPGALHMALAEACQREGVDILLRTGAKDVVEDGPALRVTTDAVSLRGRKVAVATNGFTATTIPQFRNALFAVGSFLIRTEPLAPGQALGALARGRCHATSFRFPHYFRMTLKRELLFGGRSSLSTSAEIRSCADWLITQARKLLPGADLPRVAACWGGQLGFAPDKRPLMGRRDSRLYYAMGCAGHGVPTSLAMGRELALRMTGHCPPDPAPFWRTSDGLPDAVPLPLRHMLPVAQTALRMLDQAARVRNAVETQLERT